MSTIGKTIFQVGYELSPIILTNGIAETIPGNMLPIIAITQAGDFNLSLLNGESSIDPNQFLGHFRPVPGGTLIDNDIGDYPFANQAVAANCVISKPLTVSLVMISPVNQPGGYVSKMTTFSALKAVLDTHIARGGTFTVATPAFIYTNCLLVSLRDASRGDVNQAQNAWQFDFVKPLLAQEDGQTALNSMMAKISGGLPTSANPSWSGAASAVGSAVSDFVSPLGGVLGTAVSGVISTIGGSN